MAIEHEIVVVAVAGLVVQLVDALADFVERAEIERRASDGHDLTRGNQRVVDRRVAVGVEHQLVVVDRRRASTREIEIGVVGEIHGRGLVGRRLVVDAELVFVGERVGDLCDQFAGEAFFAVGAGVGEDDALPVLAFERLRLPDDFVEAALDAAVERVWWARSWCSVYSFPSSVNLPLAMRLATRPAVAPKYWLAGDS